jgi:hypothetical protein
MTLIAVSPAGAEISRQKTSTRRPTKFEQVHGAAAKFGWSKICCRSFAIHERKAWMPPEEGPQIKVVYTPAPMHEVICCSLAQTDAKTVWCIHQAFFRMPLKGAINFMPGDISQFTQIRRFDGLKRPCSFRGVAHRRHCKGSAMPLLLLERRQDLWAKRVVQATNV